MQNQKESKVWQRVFWITCFASMGVKLLIALRLPLTGDEAYWATFGKYPALGYFDMPPMIGWMMAVVRWFGTMPVVLRAPAILLPSLIAPFLVDLLARFESDFGTKTQLQRSVRPELAGILFLIAPIHLLFPLITNDVPLILFTFFSLYFFARALAENQNRLALLGGVFFGLAFLSKYFVLFLGFSFVVYACLNFRDRSTWQKLALGVLGFLPALGIHLFWNASHCWINFYFNTVGRNIHEQFNPNHFVEYLKFQLILIGPVALYFLLRSIRRWVHLGQSRFGLLVILSFIVPIASFGLTSFRYRQGLHWTLSFYPFFYLALAILLKTEQLKTALKASCLWSGACTLGVVVVLTLPIQTWKPYPFYWGLKYYVEAPELSLQLEPYRADYHFATDGYTESALLENYLPDRVHVFGAGTIFGREDDLLTDWRILNDQNILILTRHGKTVSHYSPYFQTVTEVPVEKNGQIYRIFLGRGFKFPVYREQILVGVRDRYYPAGCSIIGKYL